MTSMASAVVQDVPPYVMVSGNKAEPHGINSEGLKRRGFSADAVMAIKRAYKTLYKAGLPLAQAQTAIAADSVNQPELQRLADFLAITGRGIVR
jgi:UDP-N-acetylglucosamine acyltransferase